MEPEQRTFWMEVLGQLHTRLRQLALAGLVVFIAVASEWFIHNQQLVEERSRIEPQLTEIAFNTFFDGFAGTSESDLSKEIRRAFDNSNCVIQKTLLAKQIKLECIPSLSKQTGTAETSHSEFKILGQTLPEVLFRLVILCAPIVLLLGTIVTASQISVMHSLLQGEVGHVSVQQKLNSPYFARVTKVYGEGRTFQILIADAINSVHVLVAYMFVLAVLLPHNVLSVAETEGKITSALIIETAEGRPDALYTVWYVGFICALALYAIAVLIFDRFGAVHATKTVKAN